jgi:hypothetical protein
MTYAVLAILSDGCPPLKGRLPTCYSPVRRFTRQPKPPFSLDLHVLSPPLTFALSQDQTLHLILITFLHGVLLSKVSMTGFFSWFRLGFSAIQFSETDPNLPSTITCGPRILGTSDSRVNKKFAAWLPPTPLSGVPARQGRHYYHVHRGREPLFWRFFRSSSGMLLMACSELCRPPGIG